MCKRGVLRGIPIVVLLLAGGTVAEAQEGRGGAVRAPRTDAERRGINRKAPRVRARVDRRTLRGDVIARGKRTDKNLDGRFSADECEFDFTVSTEIALGERQLTLVNNPADCTSKLDDIQDVDVVEPRENEIAMVTPGVFHKARQAIGNLWEALFPALLAQTWQSRELYHDIMTCGVVCPPVGVGPSAGDGLTALQGWMNYRFMPWGAVQMTSSLGWYCVNGTRIDPYTGQRVSWCLPPMHLPGSPMVPVWTRWFAHNPHIVERVSGGSFARAMDATSFYWLPLPPAPRYYEHQLVNWREAFNTGYSRCNSTVIGFVCSGTGKVLAQLPSDN